MRKLKPRCLVRLNGVERWCEGYIPAGATFLGWTLAPEKQESMIEGAVAALRLIQEQPAAFFGSDANSRSIFAEEILAIDLDEFEKRMRGKMAMTVTPGMFQPRGLATPPKDNPLPEEEANRIADQQQPEKPEDDPAGFFDWRPKRIDDLPRF